MCEKCPDEEWESKYISLRFIGGRHLKYPYRGPYLTYDTNKVYVVPPEYADLPYWEPANGTKIEKEAEVDIEPEPVKEEVDLDFELPSPGLTKKFGGAPMTHEDFILSMDDDTIRAYIEGQGGKVDGRWGRKNLVAEALELQ